MLHYRKNIGGNWETCSLTKEEAKSIQETIIKIGISKHKEIQDALATANEARKTKGKSEIVLPSDCAAVILAKVMPSYESLANDYIEAQIKQKLNPTPTA